MGMAETLAAQRRVLTGYLAAAAATVAAFLAGPGQIRVAAVAASTILSLAAIVVGLRRWRRDRYIGVAVAVGMALLSVEYVRRLLRHMGHATNGDGLSDAFIGLTFLCLLAAALAVVVRHASSDKGGVIDAAVVGIACAGPVWEFVQRPRVEAQGAGAGMQVFVLFETFVLFALAGAIGRIAAATAVRARFSLRALYITQATAVVGFVGAAVTTDPATNGRAGWVTLPWICCYLSLGAAFLHPYSDGLPVPERYREPTLTYRRLLGLGAVLTVVPLAGSAPQLAGRAADGLLVTVGTLVAVALVLLRIGQLIAQRAADQRALAELAAHDDLTGLPNRRTMMTLLDRALSAPAGDRVTVLYCDLDGFKPVNDTFGHRAGDEVLRIVARRLHACVRAGDAVGRLGGDEFLVICQGLGDDEAAALQHRIERAVAEPIAWDGRRITVGVTVGRASGAAGPAERTDVDSLIAVADQQMYAGKRARVPGRPVAAEATPR